MLKIIYYCKKCSTRRDPLLFHIMISTLDMYIHVAIQLFSQMDVVMERTLPRSLPENNILSVTNSSFCSALSIISAQHIGIGYFLKSTTGNDVLGAATVVVVL